MDDIKINKTTLWKIVSVILLVLLVVFYSNGGLKNLNGIGEEAAKEKTTTLLNQVLGEQGNFEILDVKEENGLYSLNVLLDGQNFNTYLTKDGNLFFPSVIRLDTLDKRPLDQNNTNL